MRFALAALALVACSASARTTTSSATNTPTQSPLNPPPPDAILSFDRGPRSPILRAAFSPGGARIATAHEDWHVEVWSVEKRVREYDLVAPGQVAAMAWSLDGSRLGVLTHNGAIVWKDGEQLGRVHGDERTVSEPLATFAFSPDLGEVARISEDGDHLDRIEVATGARKLRIQLESHSTQLLGYADEGRAILVRDLGFRGFSDGASKHARQIPPFLTVYDAATGSTRGKIDMTLAVSPFARPSPDAKTIAIIARLPEGQQRVDLVDVKTGHSRGSIPLAEDLVFTPDSANAVALFTHAHGTLLDLDATLFKLSPVSRVRSVDSQTVDGVLRNTAAGPPLYTSTDGTMLVSVNSRTAVATALSGKNKRGFGVSGDATILAVDPDGKRVLTSSGTAFVARSMREANEKGEWLGESTVLLAADGTEKTHLADITFSGDGRAIWSIISGPFGEIVETFGDEGAAHPKWLGTHYRLQPADLLSPPGRSPEDFSGRDYRALIAADTTLRSAIWKAAPTAQRIAWSQDGKVVAASTELGGAIVLDRRDPPKITRLTTDPVRAIAVSPDGWRIAMADRVEGAHQVSIRNLATGATLKTGFEDADELAFSSGGDVLCAKKPRSNVVAFIDVDKGNVLSDVALPVTLTNVERVVTRELPHVVTRALVSKADFIQSLFDGAPSDARAFAVAPGGKVFAFGGEDIMVERESPRRALRLVGYELGGPIHIAIDQHGNFDGSAESLLHVRVREKEDDAAAESGPVFDRHRRPGLLEAFLRGD